MKKNNITIHDIAHELNISASTVSRALNNNKRISEETRNLVFRKAKEMGYGQAMFFEDEKKASKTIAVLLPNMRNPIYVYALKVIQDYAYKKDYFVIVAVSQNSENRERKILANFLALDIAGLIISHVNEHSNGEKIGEFLKKSIPVVNFFSVNNDVAVPKIIVDAFQGAFEATEHLLAASYNKIALLLDERKNVFTNELRKGYIASLKQHNIAVEEQFIIENNLSEQEIRFAFSAFFRSENKPDAIILPDRTTALHALHFLKNNGLESPRNMAIVAFADEEYKNLYAPVFSSVRFSAKHIGMSAIRELLKLMEQDEMLIKEKMIIEPVKFIIGNTTIRYD